MKLYHMLLFIFILFISEFADAQTRIYIGPGGGHRYRRMPVRQKFHKPSRPKFEPSVNLSFGYGFPNVDKQELVDFVDLNKGNATQMGPVTGAIDYRFSRNMGIGVLVTHGKVSVPYYDFSGAQAIKGSLDNWAFMLNITRYIPVSGSRVLPYIRTAIGVNSWKQDYTDRGGSKLNFIQTPSELAYQAGIGANFYLSKNAGFFLEAGYGKYILHGGISFKF